MNHWLNNDPWAPWNEGEDQEENCYEENRCEACGSSITLGDAKRFKEDRYDGGIILCHACQIEMISKGFTLKNFSRL